MANPSDAGSCTSLTVAATGVRRFTVDVYSVTKWLAWRSGDKVVYYQSDGFSVGGHVRLGRPVPPGH
uniref:Uncharacterized protein n=1 Tax=Oryza brachyantha TaxID=4533 RepID=J3KZQ1_ORYBR